jgi:predicted acetyltransferase
VDLRLRPLRPDDEDGFLAAHRALLADRFQFALGHARGMSWPDYLRALEGARRGVDLPNGYVPATFLVADAGGALVGRVSIRHSLNEHLLREGGHIGYGVVPAARRKGYATEILRQSLVVARALGVDRVLVTCDAGNVGSATVIERCGGALESVVDLGGGQLLRRYWIE